MVRFALSLVTAAVVAIAGYGSLGAVTHTSPQEGLKVIAVVVAHAHHHSSLSTLRVPENAPVVQ
jgi:hypothetical protein